MYCVGIKRVSLRTTINDELVQSSPCYQIRYDSSRDIILILVNGDIGMSIWTKRYIFDNISMRNEMLVHGISGCYVPKEKCRMRVRVFTSWRQCVTTDRDQRSPISTECNSFPASAVGDATAITIQRMNNR